MNTGKTWLWLGITFVAALAYFGFILGLGLYVSQTKGDTGLAIPFVILWGIVVFTLITSTLISLLSYQYGRKRERRDRMNQQRQAVRPQSDQWRRRR